MLKVRVMPCLLLMNKGLYKTVKFKGRDYLGDPINAIKIYNEKEVDELILLDIAASADGREPDYTVITDIASECFMPVCYGGGVKTLEQAKRIFGIGIEKISLNSAAIESPTLITEIANAFGSQSIIVSMDVKKNFWGKKEVFRDRGNKSTGETPVNFAKAIVDKGAGELLITNIDREGTWEGYDLDLIQSVSSSVSIPVIANGGAGNLQHLQDAVKIGGASAVAMGSMVVYQKKGLGVLISFPNKSDLEQLLDTGSFSD